jgi:hypothetical protein
VPSGWHEEAHFAISAVNTPPNDFRSRISRPSAVGERNN